MAQVAPYMKPLPQMEPEAKPYWEYLRQHELRIQRCNACQKYFFPPEVYCPHCLSEDVAWTPVSGKGTVYSWVNFHRAYTPAYEGEIPYNVSLIDLDEGVRLYSNVVGIPAADVKCGLRVEVIYEDVTPEITLAKFRPIE